jgi:hypothetical protein
MLQSLGFGKGYREQTKLGALELVYLEMGALGDSKIERSRITSLPFPVKQKCRCIRGDMLDSRLSLYVTLYLRNASKV